MTDLEAIAQDDRACMFVAWYRGFTECARIINAQTSPDRRLPWQLSALVKIERNNVFNWR